MAANSSAVSSVSATSALRARTQASASSPSTSSSQRYGSWGVPSGRSVAARLSVAGEGLVVCSAVMVTHPTARGPWCGGHEEAGTFGPHRGRTLVGTRGL
ncbi:Uncharacterised protein [Mycobacteroides abscessus]|nr:Uncharacterised protein [Mycobacteroides abscessus]